MAPADYFPPDPVSHAGRRLDGKVAIVTPEHLTAPIAVLLSSAPAAGFDPNGNPLDAKVAVFSATGAKGLEFDGVVAVEPATVIDEVGLRGLYVALTRATQRLVLVHSAPLPAPLLP